MLLMTYVVLLMSHNKKCSVHINATQVPNNNLVVHDPTLSKSSYPPDK